MKLCIQNDKFRGVIIHCLKYKLTICLLGKQQPHLKIEVSPRDNVQQSQTTNIVGKTLGISTPLDESISPINLNESRQNG